MRRGARPQWVGASVWRDYVGLLPRHLHLHAPVFIGLPAPPTDTSLAMLSSRTPYPHHGLASTSQGSWTPHMRAFARYKGGCDGGPVQQGRPSVCWVMGRRGGGGGRSTPAKGRIHSWLSAAPYTSENPFVLLTDMSGCGPWQWAGLCTL
jgi:hypothetical protein